MTEKELFELKDEIEESHNRSLELKGELSSKKKKFKEDWGFDSTKVARVEIVAIDKKLTKVDKDIRELSEELEKEMEQWKEERS
jgi:hypothetical protein